MDFNIALKKAPVCDKCGKQETIIGCHGGEWIFSCRPCVKKDIKEIMAYKLTEK